MVETAIVSRHCRRIHLIAFEECYLAIAVINPHLQPDRPFGLQPGLAARADLAALDVQRAVRARALGADLFENIAVFLRGLRDPLSTLIQPPFLVGLIEVIEGYPHNWRFCISLSELLK